MNFYLLRLNSISSWVRNCVHSLVVITEVAELSFCFFVVLLLLHDL